MSQRVAWPGERFYRYLTSQMPIEEVTTCLGKWYCMSLHSLDRRFCNRQILLSLPSPQGTAKPWCLLSEIRQE